ncbi:helix-turn-helix domain-containing protein [Prochlorococcus sp. AH-716-K03]|nr:helix-turn-helix domain-containing protein [Prochlorococcus sp. AH-716-K03]
MNYHNYSEYSSNSVRIIIGQSVLIDPSSRPTGTCLEIESGIARVFCPCEETEGMTLAFLQSGDQLRTDLLCSEGVCVEALTDLSFYSNVDIAENSGFDAVNEWTLQLLRIRHLGNSEQRLQALFSILVNRLGRRCGQWCELPFRLTHERIGELIGSTRVTSTRLISKLRASELLVAPIGQQTVSVAPSFIESSPL